MKPQLFKDNIMLVGLVVVVLAFLWRGATMQGLFFGSDEIGTDLIHHAYAYREFFATDYLKQGKFPLWNPYIGSGTPVWGEAQTGVYYLPAIPLYLLFSPPVAFNWLIITTFMIIAIGTYMYSRHLGLSQMSAFFSAVVFVLSGSMVGHLRHVPLITALAFMPIMFLLIDKIIMDPQKKWMLAFSILLFMSFSTGQLTATYLLIFMLTCYFLLRTIFFFRKNQETVAPFLYFGASLVLGVLFSAAILVPALELVNYSTRAHITLADSLSPRYHLKFLWLFLSPYAFGDPSIGTWDILHQSYWENIGYVGIIPLCLALFALLRGGRRKTAIIFCLGLLGLFSMLLALGGNTPIYALVRQWVPGFSLTRVTGRFLIYVDFCLAILSGFGLSYIANLLKDKAAPILRIVIIINVIDLFYFGYHFNTVIPLSYVSPTHTAQFLQKDKDLFRVRPLNYDKAWEKAWRQTPGWTGDLSLYMAQRELLPSDFNLTYRIASPLFIYGLSGHFGVKRPSELDDALIHSFDQGDSTRSALLLGMENVKYLLSQTEQSLGPAFELTATLPTERKDIKTYVYKNTRFLPRAYLVGNAIYAGREINVNMLDFMVTPSFHPDKEVILESAPNKPYTSGKGTVVIDSYQDSRVRLSVDAKDGGFLVLSDTYYPGWNAYIDGKKTEIYKANYAYRAIYVTFGKHKVVFVYEPLSVKIGIIISAVSFGILLLLILLKTRTRFKKPSSSW